MQKQILTDLISGLKSSITTLRESERAHIKAQTIAEQIQKARVESDKLEADLEKSKEARKEKEQKKLSLTEETCKKLAFDVSNLLPLGKCVLSFNDEAFELGWQWPHGHTTPYLGLSGGEKAMFDVALASALLGSVKEKLLIGEFGEVPGKNIREFIEKIAELKPDMQILGAGWHNPKSATDWADRPEWRFVQVVGRAK